MKNIMLWAALCTAFIFTSCRTDFEKTTITDDRPGPNITQLVEGRVAGQVIDEAGTPVAGATVYHEGNSTFTDDKGLFFFNNQDLNAGGTYVVAEKAGYFHGSIRFFPEEGATNFPRIMLMEEEVSGTFSANAGGTINLPQGGQIDFPANAIRTDDGQVYTGQVEVSAKWLDPTADDLGLRMPGNLQGFNTDGEEVAMATFGMMAVELRGGGQELNLIDGQQATLHFPVPNDLLGNAPQEIPLWSFDEEDGIWREEGSATLDGDKYVGQVGHFSFWNCDVPFPLVQIHGQFVDGSGIKLVSNLEITITVKNSGISAWGLSDGNGVFCGKVPQNEILIMEVVDFCGDVVYSAEIGPFTSNTDLGDIPINYPATNLVTATGEALDCDGDPITNGVVVAEVDGQTYLQSLDNGNPFSMTFIACNGSDITFTIVDSDNQKSTAPILQSFATSIDLGSQVVCDDIDEFISVQVGSDSYFYPGPLPFAQIFDDSVGVFLRVKSFSGNQGLITIDLGDYTGTGTYDPSQINFYTHVGDGDQLLSQCFGGCGFTSVEITQAGGVGDYIEGNLEGVLDYNDPISGQTSPENVNITFRVILEQ